MKQIIALCRACGGTEWFIAEQETCKYPPLKCVELCYQALRKMGV